MAGDNKASASSRLQKQRGTSPIQAASTALEMLGIRPRPEDVAEPTAPPSAGPAGAQAQHQLRSPETRDNRESTGRDSGRRPNDWEVAPPHTRAPIDSRQPSKPHKRLVPTAPWIVFAFFTLIGCGLAALAGIGAFIGSAGPAYVAATAAATRPSTLSPTASPTRTSAAIPNATSPKTAHVYADGSGDYTTLAEAVAHTPSGNTIELGGTHVLDGPLDVTRRITLRGAGMDQTEVVSDAEGYVIYFGTYGIVVEGIAFRHQGSAAAMVAVTDSDVAIEHCRFSGAVWDENTMRGGVGLGIYGASSARVTDSECSGNQLQGIAVYDQAQPSLINNSITGNADAGIVYSGQAGGSAKGNDTSRNSSGIIVAESAAPALVGNTCNGNAYDGIWFSDLSAGTAEKNTCSGNGYNGISVSDEAQPEIMANTLSGNQAIGVAYYDNAGGSAYNNHCSDNQQMGIYVQAGATVSLELNFCGGNRLAQVYDEREGAVAPVQESATPTASFPALPLSLLASWPSPTPSPTAMPPAGYGSVTFVNPIGAELNITFTRRDDNLAGTWQVGKYQALASFFLLTGRWTYTIDAPPPWDSINGEITIEDGQYYTITANIPRMAGQ